MNNNTKNNTNNNAIDRRGLTTLAFVIGLALTEGLSSTEQNAIGNFIMLIGQTLCTNASFVFNDEQKNPITSNTLKRASDIINQEIKKL